MILVFGGTTEGRMAAQVLEEAGKRFYYSTKTGEQELTLAHGMHVAGAMDEDAMRQFCQEHDIRLLIDAAHPFAARLHDTVASVTKTLQLPAIRYERIFPEHDESITWVDRIEDITFLSGERKALSTLGVQSIGRLKALRAGDCRIIYRILQRENSLRLAHAQGAADDELCFYHEGADEAAELQRLRPDVILLKESGLTGGFSAKVAAAKALGIRIIAIRRPATPDIFHVINGKFGLRRMVEHFLTDYFPLKSGLTTGTCATAAVKAALLSLMGADEEAVWVQLPDGESVLVDIDSVAPGCATVVKDFSDDPDVTRGCKITAKVVISGLTPAPSPIRFLQGEGVGRVTLPGLGIPVGEPAINPVPRQMIEAEVRALTDAAVDVTISVEGGRELAKRTFNERVGVVDGISIIGTSGIVRPLSNEAFVESIGRELQVARALGCDSIGLASGKRGEEALHAAEPSLRVVHYGNFIGASLQRAHALGFRRAVLGIMIGKAVKLAEGNLDTHSHKVLMNKAFLADVASEVGVADAASLLESISMARELWQMMPPAFFDRLRELCLRHCRTAFPTGELEIRIISEPNLTTTT